MATMTMAVTPEAAAQAMAPATNRAAQAVYNDFHHNQLTFEAYLANTATATHSQFSSLKVSTDAQLCPRHLAHLKAPQDSPECHLGKRCPFRHENPPAIDSRREQNSKRTICKHWLRGLCKRGDQCDYLHEYDMRKMPECRFFATFGYCNSGDDCLYLHIDPKAKIRECELYKRGFCPRGPDCHKKHVRRPACPYYLAGFCPSGPDCRMGHVKSTMPSVQSRSNSPLQTHKPLTAEEAFGRRNERTMDFTGGGQQQQPQQRQQRQHFDSNTAAAGGSGGQTQGGRRDLNTVTCYKCGEIGHFANMCPNQNVPGNRGGMERSGGGRERPTGGQGGGGGGQQRMY